jgi:hypothetical protein
MLCIILICMVSCTRIPEGDIKATEPQNIIKHNVICLTAYNASLKSIGTNYCTKWIGSRSIGSRDFSVGASEKRRSSACSSWWNFASSSKERIEVAKRDWREGRFPKVPGDDKEFIPLPDDA